MVKAKNKKLKSKKTKDKKMNTKTITLPKKNIETKIDAKSGKASGNLIKNNPATSNSSSARPQRNIEIKIDQDNLNGTKLNDVSDTLIHAHQFSGKWIKDQKYFVDIHGLEHIQSLNLSRGFPVYSWKKYAYITKSFYYKKFEINLFKNSTHLICSGEDIYEKVKKYQNSTVVRNGIFLNDFKNSLTGQTSKVFKTPTTDARQCVD